QVHREVGAPPPGHAELADRVRADPAHEAVTQLDVVGEVDAVRTAVALIHRLQGGIEWALPVLGERLDLGAWPARVVIGDRQPASRIESGGRDLSAGRGGVGAADPLPAARGSEVGDITGAGIRRRTGRGSGCRARMALWPWARRRGLGARRGDE